MIPEKNTGAFRGPSILPIARALEMKTAPESPVLLSFSEEEWERSIRGIELTKGPIPEGAARLVAIRLEPDPAGPIVIHGLCPSTDPNVVCVPQYVFQPEKLFFVGCECYPIPEREEPLPPPSRFGCQLAYVKGRWRCEGECEGSCTLALQIPIPGGPSWLACACQPVRRPHG